MKTKIFSAILVLFTLLLSASPQENKKKTDPAGTWKYEAPTAPYGYTEGTILIGYENEKLTTSVSLTGSEYKIPAENVKLDGKILTFDIFIETETIHISLTIESNTKMSGKATYSEGEIPLVLTRELPSASK